MRRFPAAWLTLWIAGALLFSGSKPTHDLKRVLDGPSFAHPLGFDAFGRDLLATVLRASLTSAAFALLAVAFSTGAAILFGGGMALSPRPLRYGLERTLETLLAFPSLLFALAWAALRGPGWDTLAFSLVIGTVPGFTRLVYARTRELLAEEYVLAARGLGASPWVLLRNHLTPALLALCKVKVPNLFAHALMAEATLSFLGIGAPIGRDTWGALLSQGKDYLFERPHVALGAGLPLALTVLSLQIMTESRYHGRHVHSR